ncbi:ras and Rab interactor 3-like [Carcharodon carcharias]|uniref:ras and Rab interactor 3-like n=1 Tax=Carcharodon carcharias TaxID=13397 RepID=UPI001B7EADBA|nr:ras and Rab interactor 3-like [Carcharodon carcharias]
MLRTSLHDTSDSEHQMSPYSPNKQLCNGGYQRPQEEEDQRDISACSKLSLFDKLTLSHNIWLQLGIEPFEVKQVLGRQPPGTFLLWSNNCGKNKILTVRLGNGTSESEDFIVKEDGSVFYLEHSYLGFSSLFQLIGYYCVSRDVLPFRLQLPPAILHMTSKEELQQISALGMMFWDSPLNQSQGAFYQETTGNVLDVSPTPSLELLKQQHLPMCSIQVTAENGALFFINPLFLKEHGDSWLTKMPLRAHPFRHSRLAVRCRKPSVSSEASPTPPQKHQEMAERSDTEGSDSGKSLEEEEEIVKGPVRSVEKSTPSESTETALRRKNFTRRAAWSWGEDTESNLPERKVMDQDRARPRSTGSEVRARDCRTLPVHYRASWLEGGNQGTSSRLLKSGSETSLFACDSPPLPPISELDSLSISSMEDESDPAGTVQKQQKCHSTGLSDKVRFRLSAVGHAFTGLMSTDRRIRNKIMELGQDKGSYFGSLVQGFISYAMENKDKYASSTEMLQGVYHMITSLRHYLSQSSELTHIRDQSDHEECDIDASIEKALQKCILKPLRDHIYSCLLDFHTKDGSLKKLRDNQLVLQSQSLAELSVLADVPDAVGLEKIQQKFNAMHSSYCPWKKVTQLLKACKLIYEAMSATSGKPYGADDFLPVLTYVLASSNLTNLSLDVEYMMELLDQSQLQGEGGYYLVTMFGALYHISNFQPRHITRQMSDEAKSSLRQWRRRRTLHHTQSKRRSAQDLLHISFREPCGIQATILAPAHTSMVEVRKACGEKFEVPDPENYDIFVVRGDSYQLLEEDCYPQKVKEELRQKGESAFHFVYGPKDRDELPQTSSQEGLATS